MATINKLFAYTCESCAGKLTLDKEKSVLVCASCGNTYDYEYFMGEDILAKAEEALQAKEFTAATDMYDFLLNKEPTNYAGLIGKLFATHRLTGAKDLNPDKLIAMPKTSDYEEYFKATDGDQRKFFELFKECEDLAAEINKRNVRISSIDEEVKKLRSAITAQSSSAINYYFQSKKYPDSPPVHPKTHLKTSIGIFVVVIVISLFFAAAISDPSPLILALGSVIGIISTYFAMKPNIDIVESIERKAIDMTVELEKEKAPLKELQEKNSKDRSTIANKVREMKKLM